MPLSQALSAFKVLVAVMGSLLLPLIPSLIDPLLNQLSPAELVDFFPLISLLLHKYKVSLRKTGLSHQIDRVTAGVCPSA